MGDINLLATVLGAVAFFAVGAVWYTALFGKAWQREIGLSDAQIQGANMPLIFGLCFLFELLISTVVGHMVAMTGSGTRGIMMMTVGLGAAVMVPAIGINYLYQRISGKAFAIDAGHFVVGMTALGAVHAFFA